MSKSYFIDSENVGGDWVVLVETAAPDDEIIVFYTAKSPYMSYKNLIALKQSAREVNFIECCEGTNALDFQLCTELGYRVCEHPERSYIIISNDTGYDAVVNYWRQRRVFIKRIKSGTLRDRVEKQVIEVRRGPAEEQPAGEPAAPAAVPLPEPAPAAMPAEPAAEPSVKAAEPEPAAPVEPPAEQPATELPKTKPKRPARARKKPTAKAEDKPSEPASVPAQKLPEPEPSTPENATAAPAAPTEADEQARELLYIVGKNALQSLNEALKQTFGEEKGNVYYNAFKSPTAYTEFMTEHAEMTLPDKLDMYCAIVFAANGGGLAMPDGFAAAALDAWRRKKNLNSFRSALQEKYGKEKSERYYSVIKAHMKVLDKIR